MAMWIVLTLVGVEQNDWTGGATLSCDMNDAACYNACTVVEGNFDSTFCLGDDNLNFDNWAGILGIKGSFYGLVEHVVKGPGEAGGWDNDPDIADIDGDGDADLIVSDESFAPDDYDSVWVFVNDGAGNFTQVNLGTVPSADELHEVDIDGDGDLDILVTGSAYDYGEDLVLFVQTPSGWRKCIICADVAGDCGDADGNEREAEGVHAGDIDGDGDVDIVVTHLEEGSLYWFERVSPSTPGSYGCTVQGTDIYFLKHPIYPNTQGDEGWNVWVADMDGDGDMDVVTTLGSLIAIYWNDGGDLDYGDTLLEPEIPGASDPIRNFYGLSVVDIDEDGDLDLAFTQTDRDTVKIYRNDGNRQFTLIYAANIPRPMGISAGDVDNDGDMDFYVASHAGGTLSTDSTVYALINEGDGIFVLHSTSIPRRSYFGVGAGDLDGDLNSDLLVRAGVVGEDAIYREGLYWYTVNLQYPDTSTIISQILDITPDDPGSYALDSLILTGYAVNMVDIYLRLARNPVQLSASGWNSVESIATCETSTDSTYTWCVFPESTLVEYAQYKLVLRSFSNGLVPVNNKTPYVSAIRLVFDETITPVGSREVPVSIEGGIPYIYDARGRLVGKGNILDKLPPGIYILKERDIRGRVHIRKILRR